MASKNSEESISESVYRRIFGVQVGDLIYFKYGKVIWEVCYIEKDWVKLRRSKYYRGIFNMRLSELVYFSITLDKLAGMDYERIEREE